MDSAPLVNGLLAMLNQMSDLALDTALVDQRTNPRSDYDFVLATPDDGEAALLAVVCRRAAKRIIALEDRLVAARN